MNKPQSQPKHIGTSRLEAFSDGVIAVIITIMVLELRPPHGAELNDLAPLVPSLLVYVLSFAFIAIYWNNHHHLLRAAGRISTGVMWANMHLLFWLSLIPAMTAWLGENHSDTWPIVIYGVVSLMIGLAYFVLTKAVVRANQEAGIAEALGSDTKGRLSIVIYALGVAFAFFSPPLAYAAYVAVAVMWFIPDKRLTTV